MNNPSREFKNKFSRKRRLREAQIIMKEFVYKKHIIYGYEQQVEHFQPMNTLEHE